MLERALQSVGQSVTAAVGTLASIAGLVVVVGVSAHALTWVLTRRRTARWVWSYWNTLGSALLLAGLVILGYGWLVFGLQTNPGSVLVGLGLLLLSAGLWMLIPV
ncbi:MAG TPA: hypothetical protein VJB36_14410 [Methylomirabilota bacterium]|nr:hypothetical protein [Methylomirabilota bacterium]